MFYRERKPSEKKKYFVLSFWELVVTGNDSESLKHQVFPDGCINLLFDRNSKTQTSKKLITGITLKSVSYDVYSGDTCWGMRISPAAARKFLGFDPLEFVTQPVEISSFATKNALEIFSQLNDCQTFTEAIKVFELFLETTAIELSDIDLRLDKAVQILLKTNGQIKISEVASETGLSKRQLERNFRKASGLTPKQFARICRVRATAINLVEESNLNWAERAAAIGFTDQAHLCHELSSITGETPVSFAKSIIRIELGKIIK